MAAALIGADLAGEAFAGASSSDELDEDDELATGFDAALAGAETALAGLSSSDELEEEDEELSMGFLEALAGAGTGFVGFSSSELEDSSLEAAAFVLTTALALPFVFSAATVGSSSSDELLDELELELAALTGEIFLVVALEVLATGFLMTATSSSELDSSELEDSAFTFLQPLESTIRHACHRQMGSRCFCTD